MTEKKHKQRVTIKEIAERAGVSKATVSFAFNSPWKITDATRQRVLQVAEELEYVPDPLARTLATKQVGSIGLLLPDPIQEAFKNPYIVELLEGIGAVCHGEDLSLTILPPVKGLLTHTVRTALVDAIMTIGIGPDHEVLSIIRKRNLPFVIIDGAGLSGSVQVGIHDEEAGYQLLRHVLELGHRRITILSIKNLHEAIVDAPTARRSRILDLRLQGAYRALREWGLEPEDPGISLCLVDADMDSASGVTEKILEEQPGPTALVCFADVLALGAYGAIKKKGLRIPEDITVVGFDGIRFSRLLEPPLTTIYQSGYDKGYAAASLAVKLIRGLPGQDIVLPATLRQGGSSAPPPPGNRSPAGMDKQRRYV
ncbi:MAG TPA: LacI family DNA-binding transcriptional regulator [Termitinemataceae bacterium]|nr:LacI family DNA-binding transcriptional regulator [Termitinemataceae bacterium]HOM24374.1 LacI family DNA-binding transcriptional regulator [Termitinemataceae bacterium]HPQ01462.1 LacI family DNA-binding transcriptional regulator [Termitinemataceae bacterium]